MNITVLRTLVLSVALAAASAFGQAPGIISHQGKVTVGGNSFTGTGYFKFALVHTNVSAITGWSNDGTSTAGSEPTAAVSLAVARGIFSVNLGDTTLANMTTIPASVFANSAVYLRVWFNDGTNGSVRLSPDRRVTSVGYALYASTAASADTVAAANLTGTLPDARLSANVALLNGTQTFTGENTFAADLNLGSGNADYRHLRVGGGNSYGYLYGSYAALGDGLHLGYNYYFDAGGVGHCVSPDGATARLTTGYGVITLATGPPNTAPVPRLMVTASGSVGIGNEASRHRLTVGAASSDTQSVTIRGYGDEGGAWKGGAAFGYDSASVIMGQQAGVAQLAGHDGTLGAWANLAINSGGGNVGIGTTTPGYKLDVAGDINFTGSLRQNGAALAPVTSVSANSPLASTGGATPTLSIQTASASQAGALSSADWTTFSGKESALTFSGPLSRSVNTVSLPAASGSANGYLASADWTTFNSKIGGSGTASHLPRFTTGGTVGDSVIYQNGSGSVGIGNEASQHRLTVGAASSDTQSVAIRGYGDEGGAWKGGAAFGYDSASVIMGQQAGVAQLAGHDGTLGAWANLAINSGGGNVGIGTTTPGYKLDVAGDINFTGSLRQNGTALAPVTSVSATSPLASTGGATPTLSIQTASGSQAGALSSADWTTFNGKESALTFSGPLSRSVNTVSLPAASGSADGYLASGDWTTFNSKISGSGTASYVPRFTANGTVGNSAIYQNGSGYVGIGTASPDQALTVNGNLSLSGDYHYITMLGGNSYGYLYGSYAALGDGLHLGYNYYFDAGGVGHCFAPDGATARLSVGYGSIALATGPPNTAPMSRLVVTASGAVGIGTTTPGYKLDVAGDINFTGSLLQNGTALSPVTSVSATSPLASTGGATPALSIQAASGSQAGALSSADWTTFNGKESVLTFSGPLSRSANTISLPAASGSANGYLASADWTTFNGKESTLTFSGPLSRSLNTISLPAASGSANGYLASADWTTFNSKIGGSGTAGYVPRFTASGTVGNSAIYQNASSYVGVGTNNPQTALHVVGTVTASRFVDTSGDMPSTVIPFRGMVWLRPGTFIMGSRDDEPNRSGIEGPQTVVTLTRGFWMSAHEVTQAEYQSVMGSNPSYFAGDTTRPVETITWDNATNYCGLLTQTEQSAGRIPSGWSYRLPTEAEWEYACRAGARTTRFCYGDDLSGTYTGAALVNYGWDSDNGGGVTHPVEQKLGNAWGLMDMHGNVAEWCQDWQASYSGGSATDPTGPSSGSARVIRGGSYGHFAFACRSAARSGSTPTSTNKQVGFRVILASN